MPRSAACAAYSTCGNTTPAGGVLSLYSVVRTLPPPYHGKPKFSPAFVAGMSSPCGTTTAAATSGPPSPKNCAAGNASTRFCSTTYSTPSGEKHTPLGTLNVTELANATTSSATRRFVRSVTCQTRALRVPTNTTPVDGSIAIWRASGTTAYSSILNPGGSLIDFRFSRSASARVPVCGTCSAGVVLPVCLKFESAPTLSCAAWTDGRVTRAALTASGKSLSVAFINVSPELVLRLIGPATAENTRLVRDARLWAGVDRLR